MRPFRLLAIVLCLIVALVAAGAVGACTTIVVGRDASADGCVLVAHNEDDAPPEVVLHHKVPRRAHEPGATVRLTGGGAVDQADATWALLWSEMPGESYSDSYLNEWGVCLTSDNCPSREDRMDLTDGGIGKMLRRLVADRARTAREGVRLAGELVERFGYQAPGRTLVIADPREAWLLCLVRGRHWLAWRVPDGEVCVIANSYVVREVDLDDSDRVLAAADIVAYAEERGWYDPGTDGPFDFARAYASPNAAEHPTNYGRQWAGLRLLAAAPPALSKDLPASVRPIRKLGVADLMAALRDHYEGTELAHPHPETGDPHPGHPGTLCSPNTQTAFVAQLRPGEPRDLRLVYWACLGRPCTGCFVPFYFGVPDFPAGWRAGGPDRPDPEAWRAWVAPPFRSDPLNAYATALNFQVRLDACYGARIGALREWLDDIEARAVWLQASFEDTARRLQRRDPEAAAAMLLDFARGFHASALEAMSETLSEK
ncbi:MAG: C69 family dipeptidase [Candidatus Krumholzibacteriota bacterium]|nr:C69 family dipeptidase [Candidatus Krumholzibacteriota bacterium]